MKRKLFSLLVLLLTAVTGAWADATIAKLWVGNSEEVTSEGTITGTGATEGTASVAIENGSMVLTLNNFKFNGCGYNDSGIYYQSDANGNTPLIIKIEGDNEITLPGGTDKSLYGLFLYGGNGDHVFTITGSGSLTVTVGDGNLSNGIFVQQADLVLAGGTVTANAGSAGAEFKSLGVSVPQGTLTIDGCTLKASGSTTSESRGVNVKNNVTIKSGELEAYGYSKGIKNSGGDALVFAEGVTPTLFKAGDNEASATDVSKYEGQKYLHVVCTGGDEPAAPTGDGVNYALSVGTNAQGSVKFYVGENEVTKAKEGETVTVVVTPNTGWVVNQTSGQWGAAIAKAPRRAQAGIGLLQDFELTKLLGQDNTWSFVMQRANAEISVTYKKLLTNQDITIEDITALTYTGQAQEPVVTVKDGQTVLTKDVDYTVAYSNNTNAALATATENAPTVTITAVSTSEKYSGETTKKFTINKKALTVTADNKSVTFGDDAPTYTESYDGFVNNETKAVLGGTLALACSYVKNQSGAGNYDITPSGLTSSNYDITFTKGTLTVGKKALEDGFIANIASLVYNGVAQEPAPVVTFNGMTLVKGTDYSVSYENNVNVGTATATVTALANSTKYSDTASKTFSITKKPLTVTADNKQVTYGDDAPQYTVSYDGFVNNETNAVLGGELALACDYVKDQSGVGNYTITPSGYTSDNYAITFANGTLTVGEKALENGFIADIDALTYTSEAQTPAPVLTFHEMTLVAGTDYTVAYSNNTNAGTATVTCTGQGNYSGQAQKTFTINPAPLTEATLKDTLFIFNPFGPEPQTAEVDVVKAGELIVPATDYTVSDDTQTDLGDYQLTVTGKNNFQGI
ncbi:MBG domain-containing protein, partial [Xylanibacter brevis]|uniref:MBG domain-containing protein n=1 Tax=Xylanibacter brevis TaxID=83231 RepID=UPI00138DD7A6